VVAPRTSVQQLYGELWVDEDGLDRELQKSREPRGTDWFFAAFAELGPEPTQLLVDVGARDAAHAIRLVQEHGLRAIAIDPVPLHVERARDAVAAAGLAGSIDVLKARIEALPIDDATADWIWCRDVLVHVDAPRGFAECARVLRPGGHLFVYVTCATESLEPRERADLFAALAIVPASADSAALERNASAAGLTLVSKTSVAGEWRERMIENGSWDPANDLLRLSRLRRSEDTLRARHGAAHVAAYAAARRWGIYQLLGKLCPIVYVWRRGA
jgi:ubiquinone/menaquinone biosynthesis C-methylase UbiE